MSILESGAGFCDVIFGWDANDKCYENSEVTVGIRHIPMLLLKLILTFS